MFWREATLQFPHSHEKNTNIVSWDNHFDLRWKHEVKTIWESKRTWLLFLQKYVNARSKNARK